MSLVRVRDDKNNMFLKVESNALVTDYYTNLTNIYTRYMQLEADLVNCKRLLQNKRKLV